MLIFIYKNIYVWTKLEYQLINLVSILRYVCVQILLALSYVLDTVYPKSYSESTSIFSIVNFNLLQDFGVECASSSVDYVTTMIATSISPMVALAILLVVYYLPYLSGKDPVSATFQSSPFHTMFLYIAYFTLPNIATTLFRSFSCEDVDPGNVEGGSDRYMTADYSISCDSERYRLAQIYASVMIAVYTVGVPLYFFYLLYQSREAIKSRFDPSVGTKHKSSANDESSGILILFASYKPEFWYSNIQYKFNCSEQLTLYFHCLIICRS